MKQQPRIPPEPPAIAPLAGPADAIPWSVMIPVYNCGPYLRETLLSVLDQDPGEAVMQIEVCDDASTEGRTEELVKEVGRGRIGYFRQPFNVGHIRNFETCLNRSRGVLVHLLHGDDRVKRGFYEKMSAFYRAHPEAGAAFCRNVVHDEYDGSEWTSDEELPRAGILEGWLERLAAEQRIVTPAMTVRRRVYEDLGSFYGVYYCEDWEMWLRIASRYPVGFVPEVLAEYRVRKGSNSDRCFLSGDNLRDIRWLIRLTRKYFTEEQWKAVAAAAGRNYARFALDTARKIWERSRNGRGARNQLRGGLRLCADTDILYPAAKLFLKTLLPRRPNRRQVS
jgi:glycosyltransferase involved in cell wall biosynthesis